MNRLEELIKYAEDNGYKVSFVGREELHDYAGMNPEAAEAMGYDDIKHDELQLDKNMDEETQADTLAHELLEMNLMKAGLKYYPAHVISLKLEKSPLSIGVIDALSRMGIYEVEHIHKDGSLTVKKRNKEYYIDSNGESKGLGVIYLSKNNTHEESPRANRHSRVRRYKVRPSKESSVSSVL